MAKAQAAADGPVATSQELLRSALRHSTRRNARVARRKLWWRWTVWGLGKLGRWLSGPLLLTLGVCWWLGWPPAWFGEPVPLSSHAREAPAAASAAGSSAPTDNAGEVPSVQPLQLRIDHEAGPRRRNSQLPSPRPAKAREVEQPQE
jgi:hypothetical protein